MKNMCISNYTWGSSRENEEGKDEFARTSLRYHCQVGKSDECVYNSRTCDSCSFVSREWNTLISAFNDMVLGRQTVRQNGGKGQNRTEMLCGPQRKGGAPALCECFLIPSLVWRKVEVVADISGWKGRVVTKTRYREKYGVFSIEERKHRAEERKGKVKIARRVRMLSQGQINSLFFAVQGEGEGRGDLSSLSLGMRCEGVCCNRSVSRWPWGVYQGKHDIFQRQKK